MLLSEAIKKQFKQKLRRKEEGNVKHGMRIVRSAFILLIEEYKDILKEWKRQCLTAILADELPDHIVNATFILQGFSDHVPVKERLFTYCSPRLKYKHVVWQYVEFEAGERSLPLKLKKIVADTSTNRFRSTATKYMQKLE